MSSVWLKQPAAQPAVLSYTALLLFIFFIYLSPGLWLPSIEALRPLHVVGIAALVFFFVERLLSARALLLIWPDSYYLLGFVAAAGLSSFGALWPRQAVESTTDLVKYAAIYVLILNSVNSERRLMTLMWVIAIGGLVPAVGTLRNYAAGVLVEGRAAWLGFYGNANDLAYSLVILIPLAAALWMQQNFRVRVLAAAMIAVYLAAIYVTFSRGGMVSLFVILALLAFRWRKPGALFFTLLLLAASLIFVLYFWSRSAGFSQLGEDATLLQRVATVQAGINMFLDHPLLGVGIGCSLIGWPLYAPPELAKSTSLVTHNTFAQALAETGILGFTCFMAFLIAAIRLSRRIAAEASAPEQAGLRSIAAALEISLWGFVICGLSAGNVMSWFPYILIGLIAAAGQIAECRRSKPVQVREKARP